MDLKRGDVVLVRLDPTPGSEQGKTRPGLVIQNDVGNRYASTTIVAPITSSYQKVYPVNVEIRKGEGNLTQDSVVLLNQIRTISIEHRVVKTLGTLPDDTMQKVDRAIEVSLGLR